MIGKHKIEHVMDPMLNQSTYKTSKRTEGNPDAYYK